MMAFSFASAQMSASVGFVTESGVDVLLAAVCVEVPPLDVTATASVEVVVAEAGGLGFSPEVKCSVNL